MRTKRIGMCALIALLFLFCSFIFSRSFRKQRRDHLYKSAMSPITGDQEGIDSVKQLGRYSGRNATELLLNIATTHRGLGSNIQEAAIRELSGRRDTDYSPRLAYMVQPYEGLAIRSDVAEVLVQNGCSKACIASVLHYKERIWRGELRYEDRMPLRVEQLIRDQESVEANLDKVLVQNQWQVLVVLSEVYGLGRSAPSPFALSIVTRLKLTAACPRILESGRILDSIPTYNEPVELSQAIAQLSCRTEFR